MAALSAERSTLALEALNRISVSEPYYALTDIAWGVDGETLIATVPPIPPAHPEVGATETAQVSRHLAILGSCAAALTNPSEQRHHYLATSATFERLGEPTTTALDEPTTATATAVWVDKRAAIADMTLVGPGNELLNRLRVTYAVMKPKVFSRFNPPLDLAEGSERTTTPVTVTIGPGQIVADYGPVPLDMCAGHFDGQPFAPIALVMGRLVRTAAVALESALGEAVLFRSESGEVQASALAQPGQRLVLEATYEGERDGLHLLTGRALADDVEVGAAQMCLAAIKRQGNA